MDSPNKSKRPGGEADIDTIVIHYTAGESGKSSAKWLCTKLYKDKKGNLLKVNASAHAVIDKDGTIFELIDKKDKAWHCGFSRFDGKLNVNDFSIGYELDNKDGNKYSYTEEQYKTLAWCIINDMKKYPKITKERIVSHQLIREEYKKHKPKSPAEDKTDPGMLFDWNKLYHYLDTGFSRF
jgi:AmpD protein